jgi:CRP/FNR family transcriptional regulator
MAEATARNRHHACAACTLFTLNLCAAANNSIDSKADRRPGEALLASSVHSIPARRTICHPKEWSEFVPIICQGWAVSSIMLPDGRRQILSFLMSGEFVSTVSLFEPMSGLSVESVTEVTYRKFTRSDFKTIVFENSELLEKLSKTWTQERAEADQLALDLGRRSADERIGRLILNLMERAKARGAVRDRTMEFPLRQRHIADAMGLTPVHVGKVMGEFQRSGLIAMNGRSLTIIDEASLRRVADWR